MEGFVGLDESHAVDGIAWADVFQRFPIGALTGQKIGWEPAGGEGVDHEQLERETKIIKVIDAFGIGLLDEATPVRDLVDETLFGQCAQRLTDWDPTGREFVAQFLFTEMMSGRVVPVKDAFPQLLLDLQSQATG